MVLSKILRGSAPSAPRSPGPTRRASGGNDSHRTPIGERRGGPLPVVGLEYDIPDDEESHGADEIEAFGDAKSAEHVAPLEEATRNVAQSPRRRRRPRVPVDAALPRAHLQESMGKRSSSANSAASAASGVSAGSSSSASVVSAPMEAHAWPPHAQPAPHVDHDVNFRAGGGGYGSHVTYRRDSAGSVSHSEDQICVRGHGHDAEHPLPSSLQMRSISGNSTSSAVTAPYALSPHADGFGQVGTSWARTPSHHENVPAPHDGPFVEGESRSPEDGGRIDGSAAVRARSASGVSVGEANHMPLRPPTSPTVGNTADYALLSSVDDRRLLQKHSRGPRHAQPNFPSSAVTAVAHAAAEDPVPANASQVPSPSPGNVRRKLSGNKPPRGDSSTSAPTRHDHKLSAHPRARANMSPASQQQSLVPVPQALSSKQQPTHLLPVLSTTSTNSDGGEELGTFGPSFSAPNLSSSGSHDDRAEMLEARGAGGFPSSMSHQTPRPNRKLQSRRPPPLITPDGGGAGFSAGDPTLAEGGKRIPLATSQFETKSYVKASRPSASRSKEIRPTVERLGTNNNVSSPPARPATVLNDQHGPSGSEVMEREVGGREATGNRAFQDRLRVRKNVNIAAKGVRVQEPPGSTDKRNRSRHVPPAALSSSARTDFSIPAAGPASGDNVGPSSTFADAQFGGRSGRPPMAEDDPFGVEEASLASFGSLPTNSAAVRAANGIVPVGQTIEGSGLQIEAGSFSEEEHFVFGSDGNFTDGGFVITSSGVMQTPESVRKLDQLVGQNAPRSTNFIPVQSLEDFHRGSSLGSGAHGQVYLASHRGTGARMAVKVINVYDDEKRMQMRKELRTLMVHNDSRFLVRTYGAFYDGKGHIHVTLEYMDRGALSDAVLKRGPMSEAVVRNVARDCLGGLAYLHGSRILHRDFKTANILLSSRGAGSAKLSDFGLVRDLNPGASTAETFVGTLAYMSPERLHGSGYTFASDVWGLGISLVECVLGKYPFEKPQSYFDYVEAASTNPWELLGDLVSADMMDFVLQCTQLDPSQRASVAQLRHHRWLSRDTNESDRQSFRSWLDSVPEVTSSNFDKRPTVSARTADCATGRLPLSPGIVQRGTRPPSGVVGDSIAAHQNIVGEHPRLPSPTKSDILK